MKGIQIMGKGLMSEYPFVERISRRINYSFQELIEPVFFDIEDYYWLFSSPAGFYSKAGDGDVFTDYEDNYPELVLQEDSSGMQLLQKGFLNNYGKFIIPDWTDIYGISNIISLEETKIDIDFLMNTVEIYLSCIDGAYWEIFAKDEELIESIRDHFPFSVSIFLEDKIL